MKGNEVRVVFFLQPVNQFKDGEVTKVEKSFWSHFGFRSLLLLLGLLLGLGVLAYVLVQIEGPVPVVSTTNAPNTTATTRTTSLTSTSAPTTTAQPDPGNSTGMITDLSPGCQNITSSVIKLSQSKNKSIHFDLENV